MIEAAEKQTPPSPLGAAERRTLERTVITARTVAEEAATAALTRLGVGGARVPDYLTEPQRDLRRRLRARARSLGDAKGADDTQAVGRLVAEVAYEHWHRMLFARFLAEAGMLLWEPGVAVSLADCDELVQDPTTSLGARSGWDLAGRLASRMLPAIFKPESPVFELTFAPEHQQALEGLLAGLPASVFAASDSLGWVYQYWQAQRKKAINESEVKIGADELPAVTQLFTEPYMVDFLLHNTLGAWWLTRHPGQPLPVPMPYLRLLENGQPAAGELPGWPDNLKEFRLLDPCCGSGHFLVSAFLLLVPLRMAAEGLDAAAAVDAVLAENLHGLELDARCVELAVFALALAAWRFPASNGRPLGVRPGAPTPRVACCGLPVTAPVEAWLALAPDAPEAIHNGLRALHATFSQAPMLGSLLDPGRTHTASLFTASYAEVRDAVARALAAEARREAGSEQWNTALGAQGLLEAAALLEQRYHLVVTNVPYLNRGKQADTLRAHAEKHYAEAKADLANVFLTRCHELARAGGVVQVVMPQNWLFLGSYKAQRQTLLKTVTWNMLARLGAGAFETISGEVVNVILLTQTHSQAGANHQLVGLDASAPRTAGEKAGVLRDGELVVVVQVEQLGNPDARIMLEGQSAGEFLGQYFNSYLGLGTGDFDKFGRCFWESAKIRDVGWSYLQCSPMERRLFTGLSHVVAWDYTEMRVRGMDPLHRERIHNQDQSGQLAWGHEGVSIALMRDLKPSIFLGHRYDKSQAVLVPKQPGLLPAIWAYCESSEFNTEVRRLEQAVIVANGTLVKVPFDLPHWQAVAAQRYPHGLPEPHSDDPTQWLFHGHPCGSVVWEEAQSQPDGTVTGGVLRHGPLRTDATVLQVAVARLLGYRWPAETDAAMALAPEAREWASRCEVLAKHSDDDGIVCLPALRGEAPAADRLLALLIDAYDKAEPGSWRPAVLDRLLAAVGYEGKGLALWLRDGFFEQHCKLFGHRPFIWHVWDGQKDGFSALVNYHRLDKKALERLIHTYLGDWISQQEAGVASGVDGAPARLAAAQDLKRRLMLVLEGETPHDIFVRWKPLATQPLGWDPDLNDGVRLNIRPWVTASVLRQVKKPKLNIHWEKDRGKDVESAPWYARFKGERINDHHTTLAEKRAAREQA